MSPDDDFPPTQAAPPPPPEPPRRRRARLPREPSAAHADEVYESVGKMLPPRTWKENPLIWIGLVVAMFLAVPLLASLASGGSTKKRAPAAAAASAPADPAPAAPAAVSTAAPSVVPTDKAPSPAPVVSSDAPPALRAQSSDPTRQVITKCYENGRVVYTQTGACTGSMSAVPIDTGKNVVGPGGAAAAPGGTR
jgi:hypothetical protein